MALPPNKRIHVVETGDVFLTLHNPGAAFAVWERAVEEDSKIEHADKGRDEKQDGPSNDTDCKTSTDDPHQPAPSEATHPAVVYQVSSQHLISASPKFKKELTSWSESLKGDDGFYHVHTTDWDPEAFGILLNILHLRFRQVSRSPSLELLAKIAILVDYYRCWEAFDLIAEVWIINLQRTHPVPPTYGRDLMLWMLVSWVFKLNNEFTLSTKIALLQSNEPTLRHMELGIPPAILQTLESRRSNLIQEAIGVCHKWFDIYSSTWTCQVHTATSFECGSMLLGALTKQMIGIGMLSSRPAVPFSGLSVEKIQHSITGMKTPNWYTQRSSPYPSPSNEKHPCSLDLFKVEINRVVSQAQGLVLSNFVDRAVSTIDIATPLKRFRT